VTPAPSPASTAEKLLGRYTAALDAARSFVSKAEVKSRQDFEFDAGLDPARFGSRAVNAHALVVHSRIELRTDGVRTRRITYEWGDVSLWQRAVDESRPSYRFSNWDGSEFYSHSCEAGNPAKAGIVQLGGIKKGEGWKQLIRHAESPILGYLGDERLDTVLRRSQSLSVSPRTEQVGGSPCHVLEGKTTNCTFRLWLDPQHGCNAARAESITITGDLKQSKSAHTTKLDNVRFERIDGVWIPMQAHILKEKRFLVDGKKGFTRDVTHYKRTQFVLNPDHDALGSFDDPFEGDAELRDGTLVLKNGDPQTYAWKVGKLVPVDSTYRLQPGRQRPRGRR
jgi:hypothetical protein